ncbi:PucR family transcriptional regulator ligand-binding domain-containing protein [Corynebacterium hiratae]|uniref:PucR family transcriptional regulator ligand-binding domain-containing protein n=1 Tax=Corynebacterium hiratae TaxID=3139423 RepID=UPI00272EA9F7|nr:PucR family transcriptional regulator ligand-binding domain-containing protein [Corynebacterium aurimucosum]
MLHDCGRPFSVMHPCELRDPREFVGSGAVILLTGMAFEGQPDQLVEYVRRVAEGGVTGVGFGVGLAFAEVPPGMVEAARDCDISLFTVARRVPFVSVLARLHDELQRQREEGLELFIAQQGALNDAAVSGLDALVDKTSRLLGAHACLVDKDGRVFAQSSHPGLHRWSGVR